MTAKATGGGLRGSDKRQSSLQDAPDGQQLPEGLKREHKGPVDKNVGRAAEPKTAYASSRRGKGSRRDL
jgi:hypothetical protein